MQMPRQIITLPAVTHPVAIEAAADIGPTLTTVEIAERTGKRHSDVMRATRKMLASLKIDQRTFASVYRAENGEDRPCFVLPKREIMILTMGYSIPLRAAVVDRVEELERAAAQPVIPTNYADALRLAADNAEQAERHRILAIERQKVIEAQAPAVAMVEAFSASDGEKSIQDVARDCRLNPLNQLFTILEAKRWIFRRPSTRKGKGKWQATAMALRRGLLRHDVYHFVRPGGTVDESFSVVVTVKGQALIHESVVNLQLDLMLDEGEAA